MILKNSENMKKKTIIFISDYIPLRNTDGSGTYIWDIFDYLTLKGLDIKVLIVGAPDRNLRLWIKLPKYIKNSKAVKFEILRTIRVFKDFFLFSPLAIIKSLLNLVYNSLPDRVRKIYKIVKKKIIKPHSMVRESNLPSINLTNQKIRFINKYISLTNSKVLIVNYTYLALIFDSINKKNDLLKIILTHDVLYERYNSFLSNNIEEYTVKCSKEAESALLSRADIIVAIQKEDKKIFENLQPYRKVILSPISIGNILNNQFIAKKRTRCLFIGSKAVHNIQGLEWFLSKVWPIILQKNQSAELIVCGTACGAFKGTYKNVIFSGKVKSLKEQYEKVSCCIIPMLAGSGLKIKLIEALKYQKLCVSTSIGVQGIDNPERYGIYVSNDPKLFAGYVINIMNNKIDNKSCFESRKSNLKKTFSPDSCYKELWREISNCI